MSDPMTNTEVEDVLSSIRRLVSDEKRVDAAPKPDPAADRLVLTPSLRVMEDTEPKSDPAPLAEAEWTDIAEAFADDDNDTGAEAADQAPLVLQADAAAQNDSVSDDMSEDDAGGDALDAARHGLWDNADDMPDEDGEFDANAEGIADDGDIQTDQTDDHENQATEVDETGDSAQVATAMSPAPESLSEKIAALETLIAARVDQWEPDQAGADAYAGTEPPAMAWEDAEEEDQGQDDAQTAAFAPHVDAAAVQPDRDAPFMSDDEDVLDEESLRELVADIVRQELQGALGERITRNVRKLVRREIHRALAAQDLE